MIIFLSKFYIFERTVPDNCYKVLSVLKSGTSLTVIFYIFKNMKIGYSVDNLT